VLDPLPVPFFGSIAVGGGGSLALFQNPPTHFPSAAVYKNPLSLSSFCVTNAGPTPFFPQLLDSLRQRIGMIFVPYIRKFFPHFSFLPPLFFPPLPTDQHPCFLPLFPTPVAFLSFSLNKTHENGNSWAGFPPVFLPPLGGFAISSTSCVEGLFSVFPPPPRKPWSTYGSFQASLPFCFDANPTDPKHCRHWDPSLIPSGPVHFSCDPLQLFQPFPSPLRFFV